MDPNDITGMGMEQPKHEAPADIHLCPSMLEYRAQDGELVTVPCQGDVGHEPPPGEETPVHFHVAEDGSRADWRD